MNADPQSNEAIWRRFQEERYCEAIRGARALRERAAARIPWIARYAGVTANEREEGMPRKWFGYCGPMCPCGTAGGAREWVEI